MTDSDLISKLIEWHTSYVGLPKYATFDSLRCLGKVGDIIGSYIDDQIEDAELSAIVEERKDEEAQGVDMEKVQKTYCESMMDNQGLCEKPTMEGIVQWAIHEKGCTYFEAELVLDKVLKKDGMGGWG